MRYLIAGLFSLLATVGAAEDEWVYGPDQIKITAVTLADYAKRGCWTNLKESREYLEEQLKAVQYELLYDPSADWVKKEDRDRALEIVSNLPSDVSPAVRSAMYLNMVQQNAYEVRIRVTANRMSSGQCYGGARVGLYRYVGGHHVDQLQSAGFIFLEQIFVNSENLNIPVLDLAKAFAHYLKTGEVED